MALDLSSAYDPERDYQNWLNRAQTERNYALTRLGYAWGPQGVYEAPVNGLVQRLKEDRDINRTRIAYNQQKEREAQLSSFGARGALGGAYSGRTSGLYHKARADLDYLYRQKLADMELEAARGLVDLLRQGQQVGAQFSLGKTEAETEKGRQQKLIRLSRV